MLLQNKQVAVIGGGPGGLTLARLLQQQHVNVKVYERDAGQFVRQQGATLDLHDDTGLQALRVAGLLDEFKKHYRPGADKMRVTNSQMTVLMDDHADKPEEDFGNAWFRPEIDRGPLRDLLIASLQEENIVWDARFSKMEPCGTGWTLYFENGTTSYADLVIASDGANSKVRKYLTDIHPVYSGVTAIEINVYHAAQNAPKLWQLTQGGKLFTPEGGKTIFSGAKGDGTLTSLIGLKTPENWLSRLGFDITSKEAAAAWFQQEFAGWSPEWQELFRSNELSIIPRPMYHYPLDQQWTAQSNLTMIGDAAHRMPPYAGEGANQALADALELYEALCVEKFATLQQAIASFEKKMCTRTSEITAVTLEQSAAMHTANNLQYLLNFFSEPTAS